MDDPIDQFPIFVVGGRPLIFSLNTLILLREKYHICGTLTGILPSFPQQNVFQGLPLELMAEDVCLLVEDLKVAYLVDDLKSHTHAYNRLSAAEISEIKDMDERRSTVDIDQLWLNKKRILESHDQPVDDSVKAKYIDSLNLKKSVDVTTETKNIAAYPTVCLEFPANISVEGDAQVDSEDSLDQNESGHQFHDRHALQHETSTDDGSRLTQSITAPSQASYAIYKYLQQRDYYLSPGLRFGGQFLAYPGDPLRFHSHYIVNGFNWTEKFDILDMVGGGRLGTTVKKNWVVGATDEDDEMHLFSIEWARFG